MSELKSETIPCGWAVATLGECLNWGSGGTPLRSRSDYYDGDIPWAIIGDLTDGPITETASCITDLGLRESSAKWVQPNSVLLAMYGSIGKLGINTIPLATNQAIAFTQAAPFDAKYVFYYLMSVRPRLISEGKGGTQSNISQTVIKGFPFVVAPIPEQHRIVEAIESYFTRLDDAVATLERVQRNLKRYRASVLKAVVEGRLVPTEADLARAEGRDYEPASVLLERLLAERRRRWEQNELAKMKAKGKTPTDDKWKAKYEEPAAPDADLPRLPEGWGWVTVDQLLAEPLSNGRSVKTAEVGFPVLRLTSLRDGFIDLGEMKIGAWTAQEAEDFLVEEGDFLVSRGNGSIRLVGVGGLVRGISSPVAYPDTMIRFRLCKAVDPGFFAQVWNSRLVRNQVESKAKTTAGIFKVNQADLAGCVVPLPPRIEQVRIQSEIERLISVTDCTTKLSDTTLVRADRLRQSILKWAFEGRLVDREPTDEPASALLERIKAERAASTATMAARTAKRKSSRA